MFLRTSQPRDTGRDGLVALRNPRSAAAEAYRTLRTSIQFAGLDQPVRSVLVTSASQGDGKTTVAANIGVAFAEIGKRVLLVDCDLRRPGLHALFGVPQAPGLTNRLIAEQPALPPAATPVPGLFILPAGDPPPNPAELIASARLAAALERLEAEFDLLVIDSPPAGIVTDAAILAKLVDGVILVVSAGQTRRDSAQRAKQLLEGVGARILGAVLNNAKLEKSLRAYYAAEPVAGTR